MKLLSLTALVSFLAAFFNCKCFGFARLKDKPKISLLEVMTDNKYIISDEEKELTSRSLVDQEGICLRVSPGGNVIIKVRGKEA